METARRFLTLHAEILRRFQAVLGQKITAKRIRIHGHYHLGQILYTGKDFVIVDFEGLPDRPLSERRMKRSGLRDVAGMLCSFFFAAEVSLRSQVGRGVISEAGLSAQNSWALLWNRWVSSSFLKAYLDVAAQGSFLPTTKEELQLLLGVYQLEKAVDELGLALIHHREWIMLCLKQIRLLLEETH